MVKVTIHHNDGCDVVSDFTFIERIDVLNQDKPDVKVYHGEPHAETTDYTLYGDATITEVTA